MHDRAVCPGIGQGPDLPSSVLSVLSSMRMRFMAPQLAITRSPAPPLPIGTRPHIICLSLFQVLPVACSVCPTSL